MTYKNFLHKCIVKFLFARARVSHLVVDTMAKLVFPSAIVNTHVKIFYNYSSFAWMWNLAKEMDLASRF